MLADFGFWVARRTRQLEKSGRLVLGHRWKAERGRMDFGGFGSIWLKVVELRVRADSTHHEEGGGCCLKWAHFGRENGERSDVAGRRLAGEIQAGLSAGKSHAGRAVSAGGTLARQGCFPPVCNEYSKRTERGQILLGSFQVNSSFECPIGRARSRFKPGLFRIGGDL